MVLTYVDSGVLIFAAKGNTSAAALALPFLQDPNREFITSEFVKLEILPKPICFGKYAEVEFYNAFFNLSSRTIPISAILVTTAMEEACKLGLSAIDAIHLACAVLGGAEELLTSEKPSKPIHRTNLVKVTSIFPKYQAGEE